MASTEQNINLVSSEPQLHDLLDYWKKALKLEMAVHHVGTIESFDSSTQTCQVSINYLKTFLQVDDTGNTSITTQSYPLVVGCPCIVLGGGNGRLTFPIKAGDECLLLFNDRDMDNWFSGSNNSAPATTRLHSFSDAIALVGLRSLPHVIADYDAAACTFQNGSNYVKVYENKVQIQGGDNTNVVIQDGTITAKAGSTGTTVVIKNDGTISITNATGELISFLNTLFTDIQNATVNTMFGPQPLIMPTYAADLVKFQTFKS